MTTSTESYFKSHDHHRLFYRVTESRAPVGLAPLGQIPKAVLIFVHGLNEHSGRYSNPVNYFSKKGYTLYLFDHRGHGKSDGLRSFVDDFDHYLHDLDEFIKLVAEQEKKKGDTPKIFIVGHSLGGQIVLNYVGRFKSVLAGWMTSSANIQVAIKIPRLKKIVALQMARAFPRMSIPNDIDPKWISRDQHVVRAYKSDPLVSKKVTLKLIAAILNNQKEILDLAPKVRLPGLIMHAGDDHICALDGSRKFFEKLGTSDKQLLVYDGFYHELFNEFGKEKVFADMEEWLEAHIS